MPGVGQPSARNVKEAFLQSFQGRFKALWLAMDLIILDIVPWTSCDIFQSTSINIYDIHKLHIRFSRVYIYILYYYHTYVYIIYIYICLYVFKPYTIKPNRLATPILPKPACKQYEDCRNRKLEQIQLNEGKTTRKKGDERRMQNTLPAIGVHHGQLTSSSKTKLLARLPIPMVFNYCIRKASKVERHFSTTQNGEYSKQSIYLYLICNIPSSIMKYIRNHFGQNKSPGFFMDNPGHWED